MADPWNVPWPVIIHYPLPAMEARMVVVVGLLSSWHAGCSAGWEGRQVW